jgi:hypothetical protein
VALVLPQQRDRRDNLAAEFRDEHLPALDRGLDLLPWIRQRPLLVPAITDPAGRLVQ